MRIHSIGIQQETIHLKLRCAYLAEQIWPHTHTEKHPTPTYQTEEDLLFETTSTYSMGKKPCLLN